jgi:hypothetical protein
MRFASRVLICILRVSETARKSDARVPDLVQDLRFRARARRVVSEAGMVCLRIEQQLQARVQ